MYFITAKKSIGGCGELWNLDNIEEKHLILNDKVLDSKCQLYSDIYKQHKDDLYGDINLVSGIPFPNMKLDAKWYRFRLLNAAVSRPYLLKIVDDNLKEISSSICKIIAADGGFRDDPADFPTTGLLIGVAERYEVVCDFSKLKNIIEIDRLNLGYRHSLNELQKTHFTEIYKRYSDTPLKFNKLNNTCIVATSDYININKAYSDVLNIVDLHYTFFSEKYNGIPPITLNQQYLNLYFDNINYLFSENPSFENMNKIIWCKNCILPNTRPNITINSSGVCNACINHKNKDFIDWKSNLYDKYDTPTKAILIPNKNPPPPLLLLLALL